MAARGGGAVVLTIFALVLALAGLSAVEGVGVNWGRISTHPLQPKIVAQLLKDNGIKKVKMFYVEEEPLMALAGTGIEVMVGFSNQEINNYTDYKLAKAWVAQNVTRFRSKGVNITLVGVGNEPFLRFYGTDFLNTTLPALQNIQKALDEFGIGNVVKATIPLNADVYESPWYNNVPSAGGWRSNVSGLMTDIVRFYNKTGAPFMVNIYPFLSAYGNPEFPMDFAFFDGTTHPLTDGKNTYTNVFDANHDTLASALNSSGVPNVPIAIGEIGWATDGDINGNVTMAEKFYRGLLRHLASNVGTPLRPNVTIETYLFGLLDEDAKSTLPGTFERHWGIFTYDGKPKFPIDFSGGGNGTAVGAKGVEYLPTRWCVLNPKSPASANKSLVDETISYACDRADCTTFADASSCNSLDQAGRASYAFNGYYQVVNQVNGSCDFSGLAMVVEKDPSVGECKFNVQIKPSVPAALAPAPAPAADDESSAGGPAAAHGKGHGGGGAHSSATATPVKLVVSVLVVAALGLVLF